MNKYGFFGLLVLFLLLMTYTASSIEATSTVDLASEIPTSSNDTIRGIFKLMGVFFRMLTFQIDGIPVLFGLFVFLPVTFIVIYMLVDIIKDLIPFT
jgi:hypothetical protein